MLAKEVVSARLEAGHQLHRVQLPDPAGARLPGAVPPLRHHPADGRLRPVGEPDRRRGPDPAGRGRIGSRAGHAVDHARRRHEVRQDRGRCALWLDPAMTSPYAFYQYFLNAADARCRAPAARLQLPLARGDRGARAGHRRASRGARRAQQALATELTALLHGEEQARRVKAASQAIFGQGDLRELDEATLRGGCGGAAASRDRRRACPHVARSARRQWPGQQPLRCETHGRAMAAPT